MLFSSTIYDTHANSGQNQLKFEKWIILNLEQHNISCSSTILWRFLFSVSYVWQWQLLVPSNFYPTHFVYRVKSPWFYSPAALSLLIIGTVILEPQVKDLDTYKTWTSLAIYFADDNDTSIRHDPVVYLAIFPLARPRFTLIMY